ncbi:MAG: hypothetical protein D6687_09205 [Acidobacteria bacterium]|jgi:Tfp pilus assembly protein PilN|nr:MAG: hypothetical protein D6687_09205 [Acidobacteriota bacterium]GIU82314.1 MAG: hypothetical protein KatS3mg006_1378 [Pyrinomonadaceae bacterium]
MIENLNLSSRPFRNKKVPYLLAFLIFAASFAFFVYGFNSLQTARGQNLLVQKEVGELKKQLEDYKAKSEQVKQTLSPEQKALLIAAHKLVAQKNFGWSRLLSDLEKVLPSGVSVARISVENVYQKDDRTQAELEFGVLSRDYQSVINMIESMNSSGIFRAELRSQSLQKKDYFTYTEYRLRLIYTQPVSYSLRESEMAKREE